MAAETGRRLPCVRQDNGRGRRFELAGKILPELASAVFLARVFGTREEGVKIFPNLLVRKSCK